MNKLYIILFIVLFIFVLYYIRIFTIICNSEPEYYEYSGKNIGPTLLIIGSTHGNERGEYIGIKNFMNKLNNQEIVLNRGKIIFVPLVNYCGYKIRERKNPILGDINRLYSDEPNINEINNLIIKLVKQADFIIDIHESYNFNKNNTHTLGSTINPVDTKLSKEFSELLKKNLNSVIFDENKKYNINFRKEEKGSLREYAGKYTNYVLVEIQGGINNPQPLNIILNHNNIIIENIVKYLNLI